jgi:hypothetical protein
MEMQDAHHERTEEPSMSILPEAPPATQQREETRETEVTLLNEPAPTSSPGLSLDELLSSAAALYETDEAESSSINRPIPKRRNRYTEDEKKHGYNFVRDQQASKATWDQITLKYNREFGVDRTKQGLKSQFDRWKLERGVKKRSVWRSQDKLQQIIGSLFPSLHLVLEAGLLEYLEQAALGKNH